MAYQNTQMNNSSSSNSEQRRQPNSQQTISPRALTKANSDVYNAILEGPELNRLAFDSWETSPYLQRRVSSDILQCNAFSDSLEGTRKPLETPLLRILARLPGIIWLDILFADLLTLGNLPRPRTRNPQPQHATDKEQVLVPLSIALLPPVRVHNRNEELFSLSP